MEPIKIIECPRDAMQGIKPFIPTERKVAYIQARDNFSMELMATLQNEDKTH